MAQPKRGKGSEDRKAVVKSRREFLRTLRFEKDDISKEIKIFDADGVDRTPQRIWSNMFKRSDTLYKNPKEMLTSIFGEMDEEADKPPAQGNDTRGSVSSAASFNFSTLSGGSDITFNSGGISIKQRDIGPYLEKYSFDGIYEDFFGGKYKNDVSPVPSMFSLRVDPTEKKTNFTKRGKVIRIELKETSNINLYYAESSTAESGSPLAEYYLHEKEKYLEKLKQDLDRKDNFCQSLTPDYFDNTSYAPCPNRCNSGVHAFEKDIDTCMGWRKYSEVEERVDRTVGLQERAIEEFLSKPTLILSDDGHTPSQLRDRRFDSITRSLGRILQNNVLARTLLRLGEEYTVDPNVSKVSFEYRLTLIMAMRYTRLKGKAVTSLHPSEENDDLILATYGKFYFETETHGAVCVWNVLNPSFPERYYEFKSPVTYAEFSRQHPCIVGIAHYGGHVSIIDVSSKRLKLLCSDEGSIIHRFRPVWEFRWFKSDDDTDVPFSCGDNGKVLIYMKESNFTPRTLFKADRREGKLKGIELMNYYKPGVMPEPKRPGIFCLAQNPKHRSHFLVGTEDGCIHKCSIHQNDHLDVWAAHLGPVHGIEFHPTCEHVVLSYGGDYTFRVWVMGIDDPVLSYKPSYFPINGARWSPLHPDVILVLVSDTVLVFDIRKEQVEPVSSFRSKYQERLIAMCFTNNGRTLFAGDVDGNILVYGMSNMPFIPSNPNLAIADTIIRRLKERLKQESQLKALAQLGPPFSNLINS